MHAASAPGGLSATATTGGTTHVVLLWLALNDWLVDCDLQETRAGIAQVRGRRYFLQHTTYIESVVPSAEDCFPAGPVAVEVREPPVFMQPRSAMDRLAPLAISLAACW